MVDHPVLPEEIDVGFYRSTYPDIASMDPAAAIAHFDRYGTTEGRIASPVAPREGFLGGLVFRQPGDILEIAPGCAPLLKGASVFYHDALDADALRAQAARLGLDPDLCPERIHFTSGLEAITDRFDAVLGCDAITHAPDLVHHLNTVGQLLKPGGRYYLILPDTRFARTALAPESTIADVCQAHHEGRRAHVLATTIARFALETHGDAARHWLGDHGVIDGATLAGRVTAAMHDHEAGEARVEQAWRLTPNGFRTIAEALHALRLTQLSVARVYATPRDRSHFCAVLERE